MARPVKKPLEQWRQEILSTARRLFLEKGVQETSVADLMAAVGGAKGMFYHCFQSKEELLHALGDRMFFENNPFEAVLEREDLNGLEKIRTLLALNRQDTDRAAINAQAAAILEDPRILAAAVEANRRVLTPLWYQLLEEGRRDGSIQTEYTRELSELLPLVNFWLLPAVFPATAREVRHKYHFVAEVLARMGLPVLGDQMAPEDEAALETMLGKEGTEE